MLPTAGIGYKAPASNVAVFNLFRDEIQRIQSEASEHTQVELQVPSTGSIAANSSYSSYFDYIAARLRVRGSYSSKVLLLTAHFDSVIPGDLYGYGESALSRMGEGISDDAVGCAAVLETFRVLATAPQPPLVDVVLLLTNGEEQSYVGLDSFMRSSSWAPDVGFFVQMDQSGARGHALAIFGDGMSGVV